MRLWHPDILPYLPDMQLEGQLTDLYRVYNKVRSCESPNHLLVNFVDDYHPAELSWYFDIYREVYRRRFGYDLSKAHVYRFAETDIPEERSNDVVPFPDHMDEGYLDVCMMNLYEKHRYAVGKSRISEEDWDRLACGYEDITGQVFVIPYGTFKNNTNVQSYADNDTRAQRWRVDPYGTTAIRGYFHSHNGS